MHTRPSTKARPIRIILIASPLQASITVINIEIPMSIRPLVKVQLTHAAQARVGGEEIKAWISVE